MKRSAYTVIAILLAAVLYLALPAPAAHADSITFVANLTGGLEVPPSGSAGSGIGTIVVDTIAQTMQVDITFSGLGSGTTAAHIHCCLASAFLTGANAGVATTTPTFTGFPLGVTSGTYSHLFDLTLASSYNPAFDGATVASKEATLIAGMLAGQTYLNIHTTGFPGGEIRGFLVTPEPSTLLLLGSGLVGLIGGRKRLGRRF